MNELFFHGMNLSDNPLYSIYFVRELSLGSYTNVIYRVTSLYSRMITVGNIQDSLGVLTGAFEAFLRVLRNRPDVNGSTRVGMVIYAQRGQGDEEVAIGVTEQAMRDFTLSHILNAITSAINSAESFAFGFEIKVNLVRNVNIQGLETTQFEASTFEVFALKNRSIHRIASDSQCFWIWLGLNIAFHKGNGVNFAIPVPWTVEYCKRIWKNPKRFYRQMALETATAVGVSPDMQVDYDYIMGLSNRFQVNIVLFKWNVTPAKHQLEMAQLVFDSELVSEVTLYGILTGSEEHRHLDFLQTPNKLWKSVLYCSVCKVFIRRKALCKTQGCGTTKLCVYCHFCKSLCNTCNVDTCLESNILETPRRCPKCLQVLNREGCISQHANCEIVLRLCKTCKLLFHGTRPCFSKKCLGCWQYIQSTEYESHACYIQPIKLQDPRAYFMVYDFECALDSESQHIPYLVTVWFVHSHVVWSPENAKTPEGGFALCLAKLKLKYAQYLRQPVNENLDEIFVFWGLPQDPEPNVLMFFDFILELSDIDCFAHNSKSYDGIFIKANLMSRHVVTEDIKRGSKYLQISLPETNVNFKDSISFMPCALRNLASDFGIEELVKGHFPHSIMRVDFLTNLRSQDYIIAKPGIECFDFDFGITKTARRFQSEALEWYANWSVEDSDTWNLKEDCIQYCMSDTILLGLSLERLRASCLKLTDQVVRPSYITTYQSLDPLRYVTLPSAVMKFYLSQALPEKQIGILDRTDAEIFSSVIEYQLYLKYEKHLPLEVVELDTEDFFYKLIACYETEQWIFLPCYMSGCPKCFGLLNLQNRTELSFQALQTLTEFNLKRFPEALVMKECQWMALRKTPEVFDILQAHALELSKLKPMRFRDAYKGGFVETYNVSYEGEIAYVDFVSQYPAAMLGETTDPLDVNVQLQWPLPIGNPIRGRMQTFEEVCALGSVGIAKVAIVPPRDLQFPILSIRVYVKNVFEEGTFEILYGLCRSCMETRSYSCTHELDSERLLIGTWTLPELKYAVALGYRVIEVYESMIYAQSSTTLFHDFLVPILTQKILSKSSGLVQDGILTPKGLEIVRYLQGLNGCEFNAESFCDSPSLRTISKLMMNALTGKWGQRDIFSSTMTFSEKDLLELDILLQSKNVTVNDFTIFNVEETKYITVNFTPVTGSTPSYTVKNDLIVAHITAYGRMMLHRIKHILGTRTLYSDTDSVVFKKGELPFTVGFKVGDLELEVETAYDWISICRKSYIYFEDESREKPVIKQKGVTLKMATEPYVSFEKLQTLIQASIVEAQSGNVYPTLKAAQEAKPSIAIPQTLFKTTFQNPQTPMKVTVALEKNIHFEVLNFKRKLLLNEGNREITTLPYGYRL